MPLARFVGPGHPDRLCDRVAIAFVEAYLARDPEARLRVSVTGGRESLFLDGDVVSEADIDVSTEVKRVMAEIDPALAADLFFTCEPVAQDVLPACASFDAVTVCGYATADTPSTLPLAQHIALLVTRCIETYRRTSPEAYGWGPDYEVVVDDTRRLILLRMDADQAYHSAQSDTVLALIRAHSPELEDWTVRVLPHGGEASMGLRRRSGRSGLASSLGTYSSHLPANLSGVGYVKDHPLNLGAWLLHQVARTCVRAGYGRGVLVHALWLPGESRPNILSARNEKGESLLSHIEADCLDLVKARARLAGSGWLTREWEAVYDAKLTMPWEELGTSGESLLSTDGG
ncbi:MAG: S-adenosylmethionine synthetase [Patescibacteria group bacterium]|nr:S-adenosylmethionine synthetase [Patescibacteria group bacterium]